ncbi:MAG: hemolysin family protein [Phycisphaerae bacterium]
MTLFLAATLTALIVSGLCSLLEATLLSTTPSQVADMGRTRPKQAAIWRGFKANIEKPIAVILILNTTSHTVGAAVAGAQFEKLYGPQWLFAFSLVLTYLMLQFTEILPKTLGVNNNTLFAPIVARPLDWLTRVLTPMVKLVHFVNRPFERKQKTSSGQAVQEIASLAYVAQVAGNIDPRQARMISAAAALPQRRVRQIMTPRVDVVYLRLGQPLEEVLHLVHTSPYTRLPVCDGTIDKVVGMVHVRDLLRHLGLTPGRLVVTNDTDEGPVKVELTQGPGSRPHVIGSGELDLRRVMRNVLIVPETANALDLLEQFRNSRIHLAVVVDEHGATRGVASMEDVLEEMVGEIEDEMDRPAGDRLQPVEGSPDTWRLAGTMSLHDLKRRLNVELDEDEEADVDTVGGYLLKQLGRFPETGDKVPIGPYEARVISLERRRVRTLELRRVGPDKEKSDDQREQTD